MFERIQLHRKHLILARHVDVEQRMSELPPNKVHIQTFKLYKHLATPVKLSLHDLIFCGFASL